MILNCAIHLTYHQAMRKCVRSIFCLVLLLLSISLSAQTNRKTELEQQKIRLLDEIELANKILEETRESRASSLGSIETVEQKLRLRQNLVRTLDRETELLTEEMDQLQEDIDTMQVEISRLKEEYAEMIRQAYKSRSKQSRLMFLMSSQSFNQAIRRLEYLKQYSDFRRRQVEEIKKTEIELNEKIAELAEQKTKKEALRTQLEQERNTLLAEREEQKKNIAQLQDKEKEITSELKEKQARAKKLENEIQRIIAAEIRRAKDKAIRQGIEEEAQRVGLIAGKDYTNRTNNRDLKSLIEKKKKELRAANKPVEESKPAPTYGLTPEATKLAASFTANRSLLPWPVKRGIVVANFGPQRHPVAKSVVLNNNGIDIATEKGSTALASFDGEVTSILRIPAEGFVVFVKHGNYFTIYKNLSELYVKSGDKVTARQELGKILTNEADGKTVLHFELWKETQVLDPLPWLARR